MLDDKKTGARKARQRHHLWSSLETALGGTSDGWPGGKPNTGLLTNAE